jgi:alkylhydroperoxidase family enzyme
VAFDSTLTRQVLENFESAPIAPQLAATLRFLRKMTLEPHTLTPDDAAAVRATGVDDVALRQAVHVAYLFNIYDRLADSMGWHVPNPELGSYKVGARRLLIRGYR